MAKEKKKHKKRHKKGTIDWDAIEVSYVTGNDSYQQIAELFKVSKRHLARVAKDNDWVSKRQRYRDNIKHETIEAIKETAILNKAQFDEKAQHGCDIAIGKALRVLVANDGNTAEITKALQLLGIPYEYKKSPVEVALRIIERAVEIKYRILNIPAPTQPIELSKIKSPLEKTEEEIEALDLEEVEARMRGSSVVPLDADHASDGNGFDKKVKGNGRDNKK